MSSWNVSQNKAKRFGEILAQNSLSTEDRPINKEAILERSDLLLKYKGSVNKELLSSLQELGNAPGKNQSVRDSYHYLFGILYEVVYQILMLLLNNILSRDI